MGKEYPDSRGNHEKSFSRGGRRAHFILAVLFFIYISDYSDRYVLAGMLEFIKKDWGISDAQAGSLMSAVLLFVTVCSVPASILVDRWSRRKMVAIMTGLWSLACLSCAFARNYWELLLARSILGVGESGYAPAGTAMLAAAYPEERRARMMGIWNMSIPLGAGLGMVGGGLIAKYWGWKHAFGLMALPGFLLALLAWFMPDYQTLKVEDPAERAEAAGAQSLGAFVKKAALLFRIPSLALTYLGFAMNVSITTALMTWLPAYFERMGMADPGKGGQFTVVIFGLVFLGAPLGGFLADEWRKKKKEARLLLPALSSAASAAALFFAFLYPSSSWQKPLLISFGVLAPFYVAPAASVTQDVVHPGLRAVSYSLCVIVQHLCGDIWSPWLVGAVSDRLGLSKAMLILPAFGIMASLFFTAASRFYARDLMKVEKVELVPELRE